MGKAKEYFDNHKTLLQLVKFVLISCVAGLTEIILFTVLNLVLGDKSSTEYTLWGFITYTSKGTMIATVISALVGQVVSFLINFKKNFKSTNNIWLSALGYSVVALIVIFVINGWLCGILTVKFANILTSSSFDFGGFIAKSVVMFLSAAFVFPMNKFVLMREDKKK